MKNELSNIYNLMRYLFILLWISFQSISFAQISLPATTLLSIHQLKNKSENTHKNIEQSIPDNHYLPCLAQISDDFNINTLPKKVLFGSRIGNIITLKIPRDQIEIIHGLTGVKYLEFAPKLIPNVDRAVKDLRADSVQYGLDSKPPYTGKNVIIGITDWGFDYTHPMFYDTSLTQTRILAAWDQFKKAGSPPSGFNYGTEYSGATELMTAQSDTACIYYDYATHGSHVAGIAGGSGAGLIHRGVAFDANYLFVAVHLDAASMIDAVNWMKDKASDEGKRLVVNMSWGLYFLGPLDGTSLLSQALNSFADDGLVIVTSAGNNGNVNFHLKKDFNNDSISSKIDFYSYSAHPSMWGQSISMWGTVEKSFVVGFDVFNGSTLVMKSPRYETSSSKAFVDSILIIGNDTVFYNLSVDSAHPLNLKPHIRLRIKNNSPLKVVLKSWATSGTVHYWNLTELSNGAGNWGMPFSLFGAASTGGDTEYGIGQPACTQSVISVAAHSSEVRLLNNTVLTGNIASFSSRGPITDGRMKPDVSAPGVNVTSSISSFTTSSYTPVASTSFNGRNYDFARFSGTSMSAPAVVGVVALMLEANPKLTPEEVKEILKSTARSDDKTGSIPSGGSVTWGWGKVTASNAIREALLVQSLSKSNIDFNLSIYPNPTSNKLTVDLCQMRKSVEIRLSNTQGQIIRKWSFNEVEKVVLDISEAKGLYFLNVTSGNAHKVFQVVLK